MGNSITGKKLKTTSNVLVCLATLLLILDIIHFKMVDKTEKGLWDFLPSSLRQSVFLFYPIILLTSYILFIVSRKSKTKIDFIPNILFLLNGLAIIILLVIWVTVLLKHL